MYSTCIFCHASLGANGAIEHFPVGRRLAFDAARGRLWVVCRRCERWNLTPLEERWEALDECERAFAATPLRASTNEVGLARLREGLELVRIGRPARPELAAWRYGDQFGRRRRRALVLGGSGVLAIGAAAASGVASGVFGAGVPLLLAPWLYSMYRSVREDVWARFDVGGRVFTLYANGASLVPTRETSGWSLQARYDAGHLTLDGADARRALALLLMEVNTLGGSAGVVRRAAEEVVAHGDADAYLAFAARECARVGGAPRTLLDLSPELRLGLEMAVHEESERRALAGELAELTAAWRRAEEVASIADDLLLPRPVTDFLRRHA